MKRGMKRLFVGIALIMVLLIAGVFAETLGLSESTKEIVEGIAKEKGIQEEDIKSIEKVNLEDLPGQIDIENIDDTYLSVYEVDYGDDKPIFVLTVSDEAIQKIEKEPEVISKMLLNFGFEEEMSESGFLKTATNVETRLDKGYVMMRKGSITGLSTNLEIVEGIGNIEVVLYKNGEAVGFRNTFVESSAGVKKDYDTQSIGTVEFEAGDIISVYAKADGDIVWKDVITLVEIATE